ncbi:hypothetical protein [Neochlamydia sp. AcF95]|nr:hypothetical protein [Neochlamydia sp. AcF95]
MNKRAAKASTLAAQLKRSTTRVAASTARIVQMPKQLLVRKGTH